jgi:hypothetical protein
MRGKLRTSADAEAQLRFLENSLDRLMQSFKLEKDDALPIGEEAFLLLRERSRCHYQPSAAKILNELLELCYRMSKLEQIPRAIFQRAEALEKAVKDALAVFSGTPSRLLRSAGQITNTGEN